MIHKQTIAAIHQLRQHVTSFPFDGVDECLHMLGSLGSYLMAHGAGDMQTIRRMHRQETPKEISHGTSQFLQSMYTLYKGMQLSYTQKLGSFDKRRITMAGLEALLTQYIQFDKDDYLMDGMDSYFAQAFLEKLIQSGDSLAIETLYRLGAHANDIPEKIIQQYQQRAGFAVATDEMNNPDSYLSTLLPDAKHLVLEYVAGQRLEVDGDGHVNKNLFASKP